MKTMNSYLLILSGTFCVILGLLWSRFEWQKYKSGTDYWITNHRRAIIITVIFLFITLNEILNVFR